ncbi:MAG TPA: ribosome biogenesis GTP-binding protein YihA/YsxC [Desulfomonilia bacterium]|nr:ribosome biogenesis GTP-binding protein YihA/YsxC [Desulfomonilia bacterium]
MKVKIRNAVFAGVFPHHTAGLPQFAFAGRSNVGKSSLINKLLNRKSLVRMSKVPGKTRAVNLFRVDLVDHPSIYLVDLPGYGYAKAPKSMSNDWGDVITKYLSDNQELKLVLLLVDIRRNLESQERMIIDLMGKTPSKLVLVATKTDKLPYSRRLKRSSELSGQCGLSAVVTSAHTGDGMDELWTHIIGSLHEG